MEIEDLLEWEGDDEPEWLIRLRTAYLKRKQKAEQQRRSGTDDD